MSRRRVISPAADKDILEVVEYIARENLKAAERFRIAVIESLRLLAEKPRVGVEYPVANDRLRGLRKWAVKGFPNYLIFYLATNEILRVHGKRDIPTFLAAEGPE